MGKAGGVRLAKPAAEITLRDIYGAVVADTKIWAPRTGVPHRCLVSSNVQGYFEELIDDAQEAILSVLGQRTLLQALTELEIRESAKRPTSKVQRSIENKR
jgi:Rrf2 family transcriptional repressor of oqxAB